MEKKNCEYFTLYVKIEIFRLGESSCKMESGKFELDGTIPFKRVIDRKRLANRCLDSSYLRDTRLANYFVSYVGIQVCALQKQLCDAAIGRRSFPCIRNETH